MPISVLSSALCFHGICERSNETFDALLFFLLLFKYVLLLLKQISLWLGMITVFCLQIINKWIKNAKKRKKDLLLIINNIHFTEFERVDDIYNNNNTSTNFGK